MSGPESSTEMVGKTRNFHKGSLGRGVNVAHLRYKNQIGSLLFANVEVFLQGPRISQVVLTRAKLQGVHKNADCDKIGFRAGPFYQARVARVKGAHCGDQSNGELF